MTKKGIAVDGPAGAGKSTVVKMVAKQLGINCVDSGSFYRTIAYCLSVNDISVDDLMEMPEGDIETILEGIEIIPHFEGGIQTNSLNGEVVEDSLLRTEEIGMIASTVSKLELVRNKVTKICQEAAMHNEVIMEGRDITTVIMPDALIKIYLDADIKERARRRIEQLIEKGKPALELNDMIEEIKKRDKQDMTRDISPLKVASDAIVLDSTKLTIDEVVEKIVNEYKTKCNA